MSWYLNNNSFVKPRHTPESAWHKHAPFANWFLSILKPKSIVELGVHNGFSYFLFCEYALKTKNVCFGIDHWHGDDHAGFYEEEVYEAFLASHKPYEKISTILKSAFKDALDKFEDSSIPLLHIDGQHYYENVKQDYLMWKHKMQTDGIIFFHDTQVYEHNFGVHKLWKELTDEYELHFEFKHGHGLGILCLGDGSTLPKKVMKFFKASFVQKNEIQTIYHKLGNELHYEYLLNVFSIPHFNR